MKYLHFFFHDFSLGMTLKPHNFLYMPHYLQVFGAQTSEAKAKSMCSRNDADKVGVPSDYPVRLLSA